MRKAEVSLLWLETRVKYAKLKADLEKRLVDGMAGGALQWLKDHGPTIAFFAVLVHILKQCAELWKKMLGYFIQGFRIGMLVAEIIIGIYHLMQDTFAAAIQHLERIRVVADEYKKEVDAYYEKYERLIKFAWPEVAEAKRKFDEEYARVMLIEQTIKKLHELGPIDAAKLVWDLYWGLERLEDLGTDWVHKLEGFIDSVLGPLEFLIYGQANRLNTVRGEIEAMMLKREQDYQDCLGRGLLPPGTWHRPMPEFMLDSEGNIIGVFQGS
jgi:hypothetical protein